MAGKTAAPAPEAYNIYRPTRNERGDLIGAELVEIYTLGTADVKPPLGARLQELEFLTGIAHLAEPVDGAGGAASIAAQADAGAKEAAAAAAAAEAAQAAAAAAAEAAAAAAARDRIAALLDPEGYARAQAAAAIEAEHEALAPFAAGEEAERLEAVKAARLAAIEAPAGADAAGEPA